MENMCAEKNLPYPLLISDIDGTLVHLGTDIDANIAAAIHRARERGLRFTLASGRNRLEVLWFLEQLGIEEPYIALGGAYVGDPRRDEPVFEATLSKEAVDFVLAAARTLKLDIVVEYPNRLIYEFHSHFLEEFSRLTSPVVRLSPGEFQVEHLPGKMVLVGAETAIAEMQSALQTYQDGLEYTCSRANVLDITAEGIHKGRALAALSEHIQLPLTRIAAIGDGGNDASMLSTAGFGIAMGNSKDDLKSIADLVAPPQEENGFVRVIDTLLNMRD